MAIYTSEIELNANNGPVPEHLLTDDGLTSHTKGAYQVFAVFTVLACVVASGYIASQLASNILQLPRLKRHQLTQQQHACSYDSDTDAREKLEQAYGNPKASATKGAADNEDTDSEYEHDYNLDSFDPLPQTDYEYDPLVTYMPPHISLPVSLLPLSVTLIAMMNMKQTSLESLSLDIKRYIPEPYIQFKHNTAHLDSRQKLILEIKRINTYPLWGGQLSYSEVPPPHTSIVHDELVAPHQTT